MLQTFADLSKSVGSQSESDHDGSETGDLCSRHATKSYPEVDSVASIGRQNYSVQSPGNHHIFLVARRLQSYCYTSVTEPL